jgi:hypothetical protein
MCALISLGEKALYNVFVSISAFSHSIPKFVTESQSADKLYMCETFSFPGLSTAHISMISIYLFHPLLSLLLISALRYLTLPSSIPSYILPTFFIPIYPPTFLYITYVLQPLQ